MPAAALPRASGISGINGGVPGRADHRAPSRKAASSVIAVMTEPLRRGTNCRGEDGDWGGRTATGPFEAIRQRDQSRQPAPGGCVWGRGSSLEAPQASEIQGKPWPFSGLARRSAAFKDRGTASSEACSLINAKMCHHKNGTRSRGSQLPEIQIYGLDVKWLGKTFKNN